MVEGEPAVVGGFLGVKGTDGVELTLPFNSRDDIVWRGMLSMDMIEEYSGQQCRYGDVAITFEVI